MNRNTATAILLAATLSVMAAYIIVGFVSAEPAGAHLSNPNTSGTPVIAGDPRADAPGTITTLNIDAVQQDMHWKGYVGNVTGRLSLDNADGFTIYDWPVAIGNKQGEVYLSRSSSPAFSNVSCASLANMTVENAYYYMLQGASDTVNATFNASSHQAFVVGARTIDADSCNATATYRNDAVQLLDGSQKFQEILLRDINDNIIYTTIISEATVGYDNSTGPFDFQIIVPERYNETTTYYFFTELG